MTKANIGAVNSRALFSVILGIVFIQFGVMCVAKDQRNSMEDSTTSLDTNNLDNKVDEDSYTLLVKNTASDITKAEWISAGGRKETLSREDQIWHYAGMEALDTAKSQQYFRQLCNLRGSEFSSRMDVAGLEMKEALTLYGNNMVAPVKLTAFTHPDSSHLFLIHSSDNPDNIFSSDSLGIYHQIFEDLRQFWPDGQ